MPKSQHELLESNVASYPLKCTYDLPIIPYDQLHIGPIWLVIACPRFNCIGNKLNTAITQTEDSSTRMAARKRYRIEVASDSIDVCIIKPVDGTSPKDTASGLTMVKIAIERRSCLLYTSPSPRDQRGSRMPSSA